MNNRSSLVTIGIPFYNAEEYLEYSIKSVLSQTYTDWKLVLVDDGSIDSSLEIALRYTKIDDRIEVISDGENRSLPYRLNQIAKLTKTKYLARMDADDIMHPKRIEAQLKIMESQPDIDVLGTNAYTIDDKNKVIGVRAKVIDNGNQIFATKSFIHPTIMGKTDWFWKNPYDEKALRVEDAELWYRALPFSSFYRINTPLLFYREYGGDYYKKYRKGIKTYFYISAKYMKEKRQKDSFAWLIKSLKHLLKYILYYILRLFNKESLLINRRSVYISDMEKENAENVIKYLMKNA